MRNDKIYNIMMNEKHQVSDIASGIWHAVSHDKILTGMGLVTFLAIVGTAIDRNYSLKLGNDSIDLHPED